MYYMMETDTIQKIDKIIKIVIVIMLLAILIEIRIYKLDNCDKCSLKIDEEKVSQADLARYYFTKCLEDIKVNSSIKITDSPPINYSTLLLK